MKFIILNILLLFSTIGYSQISNGDLTHLNDLQGNWTVGNECGAEFFIDAAVYSDLPLKADSFIWNAKITVYGYAIYNGYTITLTCANSELIEGALLVNTSEVFNMVLYPNPVENILKTNLNLPYEIKEYSFTGQFVSNSLYLTSLQSGIYFVIITKYKSNIKKIILYEKTNNFTSIPHNHIQLFSREYISIYIPRH